MSDGCAASARRRPGASGWLVPGLLVAATALAFLPTLGNGFVAWDDGRNLLLNPHWRGLGPAQLAWIATASHGGHYIPLTWLTYAVDYTLWGLEPAGYHLTSLLLHGAGVVLCYQVARRLLRRALAPAPAAERAGAAAAALFFGLHPLRVESVAWATERRDVLSGALFLAAVLLHLVGAEATGPRRGWLRAGSISAHAGALLSKSITVTAPAVLLLLDVYPLRRIPADPRRWLDRPHRAVLLEKVPYLALSAGATALAFRAQLLDSGLRTGAPWDARVANVAYSVWFYLTRTLVPWGLSPLYEAPERIDPLAARYVLAAAGAAAVTLLAWLVRRRCPGVPAAWAYYLIALAPVSGILPLGELLAADRYSYLPALGFAVLAGSGVTASLDRAPRWLGSAVPAVAAVALAALGVQTSHQTRAWRDTTHLWLRAVEATPECGLCHMYLAGELLHRGLPALALPHFEHAVALRPDRPATYRGLGRGLEALGRGEEAIGWYRRGLAVAPMSLPLGLSLATALVAEGRLPEAFDALKSPARFYISRGLVRFFEQAASESPTAPVPRLGLVHAWLEVGDRARARAAYEALRRLHEGLAELVAPAFAGHAGTS